jgi:predicted ABC-type ATPase
LNDQPFLLVIAGPNGSGNSTLTDYLLAAGVDFGKYINPDQIAATLDMQEPARSKQAQAIADFRRDSCLASRLSFSFETVMSHPSKVEFMVRAHDAGYEVTVFFVCTSDPDINIARVENRVSRGGHDVPRERIVARYWRSLELLLSAALVANRTVLFDNSALVGYRANALLPNPKTGLRPVAEIIRDGKDYRLTLEADVPAWVFASLVKPFDDLALQSDGAISLAIRQKDNPLGTADDET